MLLVILWPLANQTSLVKGEIRAAIDIGSGSTNLKVAKVDPRTHKILIQLYEKSIPVPYQRHLEQSPDQIFDQQVMNQGVHAIKALKEVADHYHVKKVIAVATAAFRKAKNAQQFAKNIEQQTGIHVRIINQDEEGILAFRGALAITSVLPQHAITWDIGGGSMQLTTLSNEGTYIVEKGKTASIPFKNAVIETIQEKDPKTIHSPNPMTLAQAQAAIDYAAHLSQDTHRLIKNKIQEPQSQVLAVGSLFNYGILPIMNHRIVKANELQEEVFKWTNKGDKELPGGPLAEVALTNPLLVLGYMKGLHLSQIEVLNVNNADGALTYPPYWE